jgi:pseudoazurin
MQLFSRTALVAAAVLFSMPAFAAEFTINMVNQDSEARAMQFEPAFLKVAPGDTVHFVAKDKGHDSETIKGGLPDGAEPWKGKISQDVTVVFTQPGLYAYKCTPHFSLGMVGLIQVGDDTSNMAAVQALKLPAKAQARMTELLAMVGTTPAADTSASASSDASASSAPPSSAASASSAQPSSDASSSAAQ